MINNNTLKRISHTNTHDLVEIIINNYSVRQPYIIAISGAMGVGKTTFTLYLKNYLEQLLPQNIKISIINTDSFLYDNDILIQNNLMSKKGFPETFNQKLFLTVLADLKENMKESYQFPVYSQIIKNIDKTQSYSLQKSHIYILEGINFFYSVDNQYPKDFFDLLILLNMKQKDIKKQCIKRFNIALEKHKQNPSPYFQNLQLNSKKEITRYQNKLWTSINKPFYNLYIKPNKKYATHILNVKHKEDHEDLNCFAK